VLPGRRGLRRPDRVPDRRELRHRSGRRGPADARGRGGHAAARRARPGPGRGPGQHAGPAGARRPADRGGGDRRGRIRDRRPRGQLDAVRPSWLARGRTGRLHPHALLRGLGGCGPADHQVPRPSPAAAPGHRHRVRHDRPALPGPGRRYGQRPRPGRRHRRATRRAAPAGRRAGRASRRRGGRDRAHAGRHQRLSHRRRADDHAADRGAWRGPVLPAVLAADRGGRADPDRALRPAHRQHGRDGRATDDHVPLRLPRLHRVRGAHPHRAGPDRRDPRRGGRGRDDGLVRLGAGGRRRGGRGRRARYPDPVRGPGRRNLRGGPRGVSRPARPAAPSSSSGTAAAAWPARSCRCAHWPARPAGPGRDPPGSAGRWRAGTRPARAGGPAPPR